MVAASCTVCLHGKVVTSARYQLEIELSDMKRNGVDVCKYCIHIEDTINGLTLVEFCRMSKMFSMDNPQDRRIFAENISAIFQVLLKHSTSIIFLRPCHCCRKRSTTIVGQCIAQHQKRWAPNTATKPVQLIHGIGCELPALMCRWAVPARIHRQAFL